ncbi:hypothetical protein EON80_18675 [bacterium]|nr:MAG: hypothetical protein EON80_18675 [bacterium]
MKDDFQRYEQMRDSGQTPHQVYRQGESVGLDFLQRLRMLRAVFGLGLAQAKEVMIQADGFEGTLSDYQETLLPVIVAEVQEWEEEFQPKNDES